MNLNTEKSQVTMMLRRMPFANACRTVAQNIDNALPSLKNSLTTALEGV